MAAYDGASSLLDADPRTSSTRVYTPGDTVGGLSTTFTITGA